MQPWENIKRHKVISGMAWKHRSVTKKDKDVYISSRYRKASGRNQQNASAACLTDKGHPKATSYNPIYHDNPVICNFCSHSAKPAWRLQTKWYGKLCRSVVQGADEVGTESFLSVDFLIPPEQYANTYMTVLIRRVTCESLFSFEDKEKF